MNAHISLHIGTILKDSHLTGKWLIHFRPVRLSGTVTNHKVNTSILHQWTKYRLMGNGWKHHLSQNCSSPYWKDYTFWLLTYSQQVFVGWISQSISGAVYSCIMLKEGQGYETSGQLTALPAFEQQSCDFGTERGLCHLTHGARLRVPSGQTKSEKHDCAAYSAREYIISGWCLGFGFGACESSQALLYFSGMIAEDYAESGTVLWKQTRNGLLICKATFY